MDKAFKIGKVLQSLGNTNSVLVKDNVQEGTMCKDECSSVHPQEHAQKGTLLWEVLTGVGPMDIDSCSLDTIQVTF